MIKKELFIEGVSVPISMDGIDYVKEIADISQPDTRQSSYSKSIEIHGTKEVNILFGHYYDVNVDSTFDASKKASAVYYEDSIEQLTGFFRLTEVNITNDVVTYKGTLHGELSSIFKDMGDSLISELDWSDLDHTYNELSIRNNWAGYSVGVGYFYPMVDYNGNGFNTPNNWGVEDFRPAVWFLEIWDRIFAQYGYTYDSTFITPSASTTFDRLLMLAKSEVLTLTAQAITDRSFDVGLTAEAVSPFINTLGLGAVPIPFDDDTTGSLFNTLSGDFDTSTGKFTCSNSGTYVFDINLDLKLEYQGASSFLLTAKTKDLTYKVRVFRERAGSSGTSLSTTVVNDGFAGTIGVTNITTGTRTTGVNYLNTQSFELIEGDVLWLTIEEPSIFFVTEYASVTDAASTWSTTYNDNELVDGDPISISSTIPMMKQKDFIMGVVKAFNLYIEDTGEKNLLIEKYNDYYLDTTVDWTNKKDGGITLVPNGALQGREYNFSFEKDEDFYHGRYLLETGLEYGNLKLPFDNDLEIGEKNISLPFGSTIIVNPENQNDRPVASLFNVDKDGLFEQGETKPRMVYFGGFIATSPNWTFATGGATETTYPYVGDTFSPYGVLNTSDAVPSILNFQRGSAFYYDGYPSGTNQTLAYGGRTLYSEYEDMIAISKNPVIKARFYLNPMDIYNLSFRNKYFIDTAYYRLIKLSKSGDLYEGEFLKIG
jgi:hypothetical protein